MASLSVRTTTALMPSGDCTSCRTSQVVTSEHSSVTGLVGPIYEATDPPCSDVPPEVLIGVCQLLKIDPTDEPQFLWIAEEAARAPVPEGWQEIEGDFGEVYYYNSGLQKLQKVHPLIERFSKLYHKHKTYFKLTHKPLQSPLEQQAGELKNIISDVERRVHHLQLPPCTPDIIERVAVLCRIDTTTEFYVTRSLKATFEEYVRNRRSLETLLRDLSSPLNIIRDIKEQQGRFEPPRMPGCLVLCSECHNRSAIYKCNECLDGYCQQCFDIIHKNGNRREHVPVRVHQLACSGCDRVLPSCQCLQCGLFFCDACFEKCHSTRADLLLHVKQLITGLVCLECEQFNASILCENCTDLFCTECYMKLHRQGTRR
eukprot:GHVQ01031102.1.p1 GENE.GHVQ01031102.1~~GHVQ01031102.1.p1  ORF type:complete len:372 (+),score=25.46 GHVQ01031102.1:1545-2660(+)